MRKWLKELREKKGFTQETVAQKIGVVQSYYNMIENGTRKKSLNMNMAQKFAEIFGVSLEFICEAEMRKEEV